MNEKIVCYGVSYIDTLKRKKGETYPIISRRGRRVRFLVDGTVFSTDNKKSFKFIKKTGGGVWKNV